MRRREFLKHLGIITGAGTVSLTISGIPVKAFAKPFMNIKSTNGKILVIIQLKGGNDGLNTVIPIEDSIYYNSRPNIAIAKEAALKINDVTGFHPSLLPFKELFDAGKLSVVQNVGYENPNRSHFRSTDIWLSGSDANQLEDIWKKRTPIIPTQLRNTPWRSNSALFNRCCSIASTGEWGWRLRIRILFFNL